MSAAVAAILEGMPEPRDLRMHQHGRPVRDHGRVGGAVRVRRRRRRDAEHRAGGAAAAGVPRPGGRARCWGCRRATCATLHSAAKRDGSAALAMQDRRGTPGKVTAAQWEQARAWRAAGCQRRGDRAAAGRGAHHGRPRPGAARAGAGPGGEAGGAGGAAVQPSRSRAGADPGPEPRSPVPGRRAGGRAAGRPGRCRRRARSRRGMRGRCCCTRSSRGRTPGRSWPARPAAAAGRGAAVGGQHVLRARRGDDRAVQAPGRR